MPANCSQWQSVAFKGWMCHSRPAGCANKPILLNCNAITRPTQSHTHSPTTCNHASTTAVTEETLFSLHETLRQLHPYKATYRTSWDWWSENNLLYPTIADNVKRYPSASRKCIAISYLSNLLPFYCFTDGRGVWTICTPAEAVAVATPQ